MKTFFLCTAVCLLTLSVDSMKITNDQLNRLEGIIKSLKELDQGNINNRAQHDKRGETIREDAQTGSFHAKTLSDETLEDNEDEESFFTKAYIDLSGRACAKKCRLRHKECFGQRNGNRSACMLEFMACYPTCFFGKPPTSDKRNPKTKPSADGSPKAENSQCVCSRNCLLRYDQCVFFTSSRGGELAMCLRGRHVCEGGCGGGRVKRGCYEDCAGEYMQCEHVVETFDEMFICHQNHNSCRRAC